MKQLAIAFSALLCVSALVGCAPLAATSTVSAVAVSAVIESKPLPELEGITEIRYVYPASSAISLHRGVTMVEMPIETQLIPEFVAFYNARTYRWDKLGPMTARPANQQIVVRELKFYADEKLVRALKFEWPGWSTEFEGGTVYRQLTAAEAQWFDEKLSDYSPTRPLPKRRI